jgi:hypothetical protein
MSPFEIPPKINGKVGGQPLNWDNLALINSRPFTPKRNRRLNGHLQPPSNISSEIETSNVDCVIFTLLSPNYLFIDIARICPFSRADPVSFLALLLVSKNSLNWASLILERGFKN